MRGGRCFIGDLEWALCRYILLATTVVKIAVTVGAEPIACLSMLA